MRNYQRDDLVWTIKALGVLAGAVAAGWGLLQFLISF
jgi:hypothetical protein